MRIKDRINVNIDDHIATVTLSRAEKMNALDPAMFEAFPEVADYLRGNTSVRVVILRAEGDHFCAGLDKSSIAGMMDMSGSNDASALKSLATRTHGIANAPQFAAWMWRECEVPVIAAIKGVAFGGGLQIALGADMRFVSPDASFSIMELKWGIVPDMSSTQIMRHLVRDDVIRELTYTARVFNAEDALNWGFVTAIVDDPYAHALDVARTIVDKNPVAVRSAKRIIDKANYQSQAEGLLYESEQQDQIIGSANQIEAIQAQLEQRTPEFSD